MLFRRVQHPLHFDHINNLWFIEQAQHEIDTYGTGESGNHKLCSFRNMKEKGIQKFERNVSLSCLRNNWLYLKKKYKNWVTLTQLVGECYNEVTGTFSLTEPEWVKIFEGLPKAMEFGEAYQVVRDPDPSNCEAYDQTWSDIANHIKSGNVSIAHLKTYLTVEIHREDDITIARAFILFMMGHLWFQTANGTVPFGYFAAVNDLDLAAQYDWGSAILASLYHGLDTAVTTGGAITGFVQLLPYWFYKYCGVGHPIVNEKVKYPAYPRLRAWERGNRRKTNDQAANLFIIGRYHIDHRTVETITWEPWFDSAVSETEDVLNAKLISRKRIPLQVPNGNCEYYLGDRCWRQVTGEVRIPLDPPLSISPHISPATLHEMRQAEFVDYEQFVVGEVRETYASCWAEQISEVGHMLIDSQRMGNLDLFRPSALRAGITPVAVTSVSVHSLS
ncbi:hypothetical protein GIB67_005725 [Kingdonia uniflora]|uniref:Aminotransferase-like plant mobile domain-containing protein n=1 Tax=Kingdonia uniflora TaxID=39325 RepID=A0A7J7KVE0_9MAGN|nr:hypothetical protein GIB67_005725 [Kingdonia uniflora]